MKYQFKAHKVLYIINILILACYLIQSFVAAMYIKTYPFVLDYATTNDYSMISQDKVEQVFKYQSMVTTNSILLVLSFCIIGFTAFYLISNKVWINDTRIIGVESNIKSILITLITSCQIVALANIILNSTSPLSLESFDYILIANFILLAIMSIIEIVINKRYSNQKYGSKANKTADHIGIAIAFLGVFVVFFVNSIAVLLALPICYVFIYILFKTMLNNTRNNIGI